MAISTCEDRYSPYSCTLANGLLCTDCREAQLLEDHILEVKALLKTLEAQRRQLRGRLNARHDALTSRLPMEVMSNVFIKFVEDSDQENDQTESLEWYDDNLQKYATHWIPSANGAHEGPFRVREPLQLGSICNSWRDIAWSRPELWTNIAVDVGRRDLSFIEQLAERLARSQTLPLHIFIFSSADNETRKRLHRKPHVIRIIDEFRAHSSRWASLHIKDISEDVARYLHCDDQARAKLQDLDLCIPVRNNGKFTINAALDHLTRIKLQYISFAQIDVDWTNLTDVSVSDFRLEECFEILALVRRLTHFRVRIDPESSLDAYADKDRVVTQHDTLRHLELWMSSSFAAKIFKYTIFPALEVCKTALDSAVHIHNVMGDTFRLSSGPSLKRLIIKLQLYGMRLTGWDVNLILLLKAMPTLEYLDLDISGDETYFDPLFDLLSAPMWTSDASPEKFLPNLKSLWLRSWQGRSWAFIPQIFGPSMTTHILNSDDIQTSPVEPTQYQRPLRFLGMSGFKSRYDSCRMNRNTVLQFMSLMDKGITFRIGDVEEEGGFQDILDASMRIYKLSR